MRDPATDHERIVLVTGPSGAGRSTAINVLEDLGFEAIDNLPLSLIPRLLDGPTLTRPMALGIDARNRDFTPGGLLDLQTKLAAQSGIVPELVYLDAGRDVLLRRYSETRRRHPLAPTDTPAQGIDREIELLQSVREAADILIDTSTLTPHDLRAQMQRWFGSDAAKTLAVAVHSFSYKRGLPHGVDMVLDCRFLDNPYWQPELRPLTGADPDVAEFVASDDRFSRFVDLVMGLVTFQLPASVQEGKAHFSIGFGCTGGQHRSVAVAEYVARGLADAGWQVSIRHRELERRGLIAASARVVAQTGDSEA